MVRRFKNVAMGVGFRVGIFPSYELEFSKKKKKPGIAKSIFYINLCVAKYIGHTNRTIQINKIILLSIIYAKYCVYVECSAVGFLRYRFFYMSNTSNDTYP